MYKTISGLKKYLKMQKGFTLIELLIVIGILAVLMGIVLVAINPAKQFRQANDTKRAADVNAILNSISQFQADNRGALPIDSNSVTIDGTVREIANGPSAPAGSINLCPLLSPTYIAALPTDPKSPDGGNQVSNCSSYDTGYKVVAVTVNNNNRVTVSAPLVEGGVPISVTR